MGISPGTKKSRVGFFFRVGRVTPIQHFILGLRDVCMCNVCVIRVTFVTLHTWFELYLSDII